MRTLPFLRPLRKHHVALLCLLLLLTPPAFAATDSIKAAIDAAQAGNESQALSLIRTQRDPILRDYVNWRLMQHDGNGYSFDQIRTMLRTHPDWPKRPALIAQAERKLTANPSIAVNEILDWFSENPPKTGDGALLFARAESQSNRPACTALRHFWQTETASPAAESAILAQFPGCISRQDDALRLDAMLWDNAHLAAQRAANRLGKGYPALARARIALADMDSNPESALQAVPAALQNNPGLLFDRLKWRRRKDLDEAAAQILESAPADLQRPEAWWDERNIIIRRLVRTGQARRAYHLAARHGMKHGSDYAEAEFLAGWISLTKLNNATTAFTHFQNLLNAVRTPVSLSRGQYWSGRAAEANGQTDVAQQWYETAAQHRGSFYGQMAAQKIGTHQILPLTAANTPTSLDRDLFAQNNLAILAKKLAALGEKDAASPFLRRLAETAGTAGQRRLAVQLAFDIGDSEDGIWIAKQAQRLDGVSLPEGWPILSNDLLPNAPEPALVYAIIRQESQFNSMAISSAGARGLMQLMPATAAEEAERIGLYDHTPAKIHQPRHNIRLGSSYLNRMIKYYEGSYIMAIAAYNAGPGNVNKWVKLNGDARLGQLDWIDWIESIPVDETRNYVQRVMENLHIYRVQNPNLARSQKVELF